MAEAKGEGGPDGPDRRGSTSMTPPHRARAAAPGTIVSVMQVLAMPCSFWFCSLQRYTSRVPGPPVSLSLQHDDSSSFTFNTATFSVQDSREARRDGERSCKLECHIATSWTELSLRVVVHQLVRIRSKTGTARYEVSPNDDVSVLLNKVRRTPHRRHPPLAWPRACISAC